MLDLYKNIKAKRTELNMTQTELANKMGYADKSMISKIEKGEIDIPLSKIIAFSKIFNTYPGDLMGWTDKSVTSQYPPQLNNIIFKTQQLNSKGLEELEKHADLLLLKTEYRKIEKKVEVM